MRLRQLSAFIGLIWLGMILGVSFVATPLKFQAASVSLEIGLDIGRLVFGVFNKIEIVLAGLMVVLVLMSKQMNGFIIALGTACLALAVQSIWLLPILVAHIELIMQGQQPQASGLHAIYVGLEVLKTLALAVYGYGNFMPVKRSEDTVSRIQI